MFRSIWFLVVATVIVGCGNDSETITESDPGELGAPLFDNLGDHHFPITTDSEVAQRFFDQGLILSYGFNHAEAARAFTEATRQDPDCAMCEWGLAVVLGPNINKPMDDADVPAAYAATQRGVEKSAKATPVEQALIAALAKRYAPQPVADRADLDQAYADAMREVARQFPDDLDVQTLFAESLMDLMPWDYYEADGSAKPATVEVLATLESVLARAPDHPGAIHFYIHAVEATDTPERAEPYADTLANLVPGAGHLVHMPAHIYLRVGRYGDSSRQNELAAAADETYIAQCKAQGFYPATYYPHNVHFLWYSSAMEGRRETSINAAERLYANLPVEEVEQFIEVEYFMPIPLLAQVRFGGWDAILAAPKPADSLPYASAMWHYTRGLAFAAKGEIKSAQIELAELATISEGEAIQTREILFVLGASLSNLARDELAGRIELARGNTEAGITLLRAAVAKEDALPYVEPPYWYYPIRQLLGAALLADGRAAEAEAVYRRDLELYPHNGWSIYGLAESLAAQGKDAQAAAARERFAAVWQAADVQLVASVIQ